MFGAEVGIPDSCKRETATVVASLCEHYVSLSQVTRLDAENIQIRRCKPPQLSANSSSAQTRSACRVWKTNPIEDSFEKPPILQTRCAAGARY